MPYTLPSLPYSFDALEPHIDAKTMEIHHGKHHQAYIDKANAALVGTEWADKPVEELLKNLNQLPEDKQMVLRNNAGGHANHSLFWTIMAPPSAGSPLRNATDGQAGQEGKPSGDLAPEIDKAFGSFDEFTKKFSEAGQTRFGSGWAWLVVDEGQLLVLSTQNQDSPLMDNKTPILGLDVWEHAYYLHYQNKRPDYIKAWWNVVNWQEVERRYAEAKA